MKRLRYSPSAALDLEEIYSNIAVDNQSAALHVIAHIRSMAYLLTEYPGMGRASEVPNALKLVVPGLPYKIIPLHMGTMCRTQMHMVPMCRAFGHQDYFSSIILHSPVAKCGSAFLYFISWVMVPLVIPDAATSTP